MSKVEVERFAADLNKDEALFDEVAGMAGDPAAMAKLAGERGYDFSADELAEFSQSKSHEISDEQLDAAVGGALGEPTTASRVKVVTISIPTVVWGNLG